MLKDQLSVHRETLPNGVNLSVVPMRQTATVSIAFLFNVGSRDETDAQAGISHVFEHMLFKGTTKFPSWRVVTETIEGVGGIFNAFTDNEITGYWCKLPSQHIERGLDVISDMALSPLLKTEDLEREKQVVVEEIRISNDTPSDKTSLLLSGELWRGHQLGRPIAGSVETVATIDGDAMRTFFKLHYTAPNLTVCVAGDLDVLKTTAGLARRLSRMSPSEAPQPTAFKPAEGAPFTKYEPREIEQQRIALGLLTSSARSEDAPALRIVAVALGGSMFSRLFAEVREKRGLAYDIGAHLGLLSDTGALFIDFGIPPAKMKTAVEVVIDELIRIRDEGLSEQELCKTKELIRGRTILRMENSRAVAEHFGIGSIVRGKPLALEETLRELDQVSMESATAAMRRHLRSSNLSLASTGPREFGDELRKALGKLG